MFKTNFLTDAQARKLAHEHGTPLYVYSRAVLKEQAAQLLAVPAPFGLTVRYAMKANPHPDILNTFKQQEIKIDASSAYEAEKALRVGYKGADILLTSQQLPHNLDELSKKGVQFNAASLRQLEVYGQRFPGSAISVRLNPGIGSGHSVKTNVGGVSSSFGIWHEYVPEIKRLASQYRLTIKRLHTHIGAGTEPQVWHDAARLSLELVKNFPDVTVLNLGGGFKVARMDDEESADMAKVGKTIAAELRHFAAATGRELSLELEPGTYLTANAGILLASVEDITDTGKNGYTFLKLNTGMNDLLRPGLYGAQHPIAVINDAHDEADYVVVGHNCESGDLLTPAPGDPEVLLPRTLKQARPGDLVLIGGVGAYGAAMSAKGYNSFPDAAETMIA